MNKKLTILLASLLMAGTLSLTLPRVMAQPAPTPEAPGTPPPPHAERHPRIRGAIRALEAAKHEMQAADHDFGGHREAALKACDDAIAQLKLALNYDKK